MFGISGWEMIGLAVVALLVFGPDRLPKAAADAGRLLRQVRTMVAGARRDLSESLGPEFKDLDITDLNPRSFVRKHVLDPADLELDLDDVDGAPSPRPNGRHRAKPASKDPPRGAIERAPFDSDAT